MCFQVFGKSGNAASNIFSWRGVVLLFYLFAPCAAEVRGHFQPPDAAGRNSVPLLRGTWAEHMFADSRALTLAVEGQILPTRYRKQLTATKHEAQCKALSQLNKKEFIKKNIKWFPEKWDFCSCVCDGTRSVFLVMFWKMKWWNLFCLLSRCGHIYAHTDTYNWVSNEHTLS